MAATTSPEALALLHSRGKWRRARHLGFISGLYVTASIKPRQKYLITCPPQHGKSTILSKYGSAWHVGRFPDEWVGVACYGDDFARSWGQAARDVLEEFGPTVFGIRVRPDSAASDRWLVDKHDGGMITCGVGGALTGRGLDFLGIDDPVKNAEEALSERIRDKHWDWWLSTAKTRLHKDSSSIITMTRWHEDDLGGRLVKHEGFTEIRLPAIAEANDPLGRQPGEALWPHGYPIDILEAIRDSPSGLYWWAAQYMGSPRPRKGGMFEREKVEIVDAAPAEARRIRWWDLAATGEEEGSDPDYLVGLKMAKSSSGLYFVEDVRRRRVSAHEVKQSIRNVALADGRDVDVWVEQEGGASAKIVVSDVVGMLDGFNAGGEPSRHDKVMRARPFAAQWQAGNVKLVRGIWNDAYISEMEAFPRGAHDDQVDASSGCHTKLSDGSADRWFDDVAPQCPACGLPNVKGSSACRWCSAPLAKQGGNA